MINNIISLNNEQRNAVKRLIEFIENDSKQEIVFSGRAGTGKTYTLSYLESFFDSTAKVIGVTISNKAKDVLENNLIKTKCITGAILWGLSKKTNVETGKESFVQDYYLFNKSKYTYKKHLIIFDEASMVTKEQYDWTKSIPGVKIIWVGDPGQLKSIDDSPFSVFDLGLETIELTENMRTGSKSPILALINSIYDAKPEDISKLMNNLETNMSNDIGYDLIDSDRLEYFMKKYTDIPYITYTNERRQELNKIIQNIRCGTDEIVPDSILLSEENALKTQDNNYKIYNGMRMLVTKVIKREDSIDIQRDIKKSLRYNVPKNLYDYNKFPDLGQLTALKLKVHGLDVNLEILDVESDKIRNKYLEYIAKLINNLDQYTNVKRNLWTLFFSIKNRFLKLSLGYAMTAHKAQGSTFDAVVVDWIGINEATKNDLALKKELLYVACSRAKNKLFILV